MDKKVKYWLEISEYDLETAKSMLDTRRFLYVGFMCHQSIEKLLKGYWQLMKETLPPKTHNISFLLKDTELTDLLNEEQHDFIDELEPLNIEARYPSYKEELLKKMNNEYTTDIYNKTKDLYSWIEQKLSEKQENI
jgi:HEPN domain-containing protein